MNPELLDSLLLDHELGELSPAVAALLEAHLAHDPAAARRAAELRGTVDLARRAVASPVAPPARPLDRERLHRAQHASSVLAWRTELYRLAACLAVGLGLGWFARPLAAPTVSNPATTAFVVAAPAEPRSTFWSIARLTASQRSPAAPVATRRLPLH